MKQLLMLTGMLSGLVACGSGDIVTPPPAPTADYVIFTSTTGSATTLRAFAPDTGVGSGITTIPTTGLQYVAGVLEGSLDRVNLTAGNLHLGRVLFIEDGRIKSVSTARSDNLAVTQHSAYTFTGILCDHKQINNYLVFTDSGSDAICHNGNDSAVHAVSTNMSSLDPVITLAAFPVAVLASDFSTTLGVIYVDAAGNLVFTDAKGANPQILQGGVTSVVELGGVGENVLLNVDGNIEIFDGAGNTLSGSLHVVSNIPTRALSDGTNYYFFDGLTLYALAAAGDSAAAPISTVTTMYSTITITPDVLHNNVLVYSAYETDANPAGSVWSINAVDLSSRSGKILVSTTFPVAVFYTGISGDHVYYDISTPGSTNLSGNVAGAIKTDGTQIANIVGANWVGYSLNQTASLAEGFTMQTMILDQYVVDGTGVPTGGNISVYNAATNTLRNTQGALPAGIVGFNASGFGSNVYGSFDTATGSAYLAGLNVDIPNSMIRIDNTTSAVKDVPVF